MEQRRRAGARRAVRQAGSVGGQEAWLRSTVPAAPPSAATVASQAARAAAAGTDRAPADAVRAVPSHEPAVARRSLDDSDLGWGDRADDSNDERLQSNRPPHW